ADNASTLTVAPFLGSVAGRAALRETGSRSRAKRVGHRRPTRGRLACCGGSARTSRRLAETTVFETLGSYPWSSLRFYASLTRRSCAGSPKARKWEMKTAALQHL